MSIQRKDNLLAGGDECGIGTAVHLSPDPVRDVVLDKHPPADVSRQDRPRGTDSDRDVISRLRQSPDRDYTISGTGIGAIGDENPVLAPVRIGSR